MVIWSAVTLPSSLCYGFYLTLRRREGDNVGPLDLFSYNMCLILLFVGYFIYIYEILRKLRICLSYSYLSFVLCSPHHSSELKGCNVWHDFYLLNDLGNLTGTAVYLFSVYLHKVFIVSHLFPY